MSIPDLFAIKKPYTLKNISKSETINKRNLNYFVRTPDILEKYRKDRYIEGTLVKDAYNIHSILKKLCRMSAKTNNYPTTYKQTKVGNYTGRFFVAESAGLQMLSKDIRYSLADGIYRDFDFKNCHPEILVQLCKYNNWDCKHINYYVDNREKCLEEYSKIIGSSIEIAKINVLIILNGGIVSLTGKTSTELTEKQNKVAEIEWLYNMKLEITLIHQLIWDNYTMYADIVNKKRKEKNKNGSCFNHLLTDIENQCILSFNEYLANNNFQADVLCFDGIMVKIDHNHVVTEKHLNEAEQFIFEKTGFKLKIVEKIFENPFDFADEQLELDDTETYEFVKKDFELNHFKLNNPASYVKIDNDGSLIYYSSNLFQQVYENKYYKEVVMGKNDEPKIEKKKFLRNGGFNSPFGGWFADENIRTYDRVDFLPPPLHCPVTSYNSWSGFEIEKSVPYIHIENYEEDPIIKRWLEFGRNLIATKQAFEYMINFFAFIVQFPALKNKVAALLKGTFGTGKNAFIEVIINIIGKNLSYSTSNIERDILGKFSVAVEGKILNVFDEINGKDTKKIVEHIKDMITNEHSNVEKKGLPAVVVRDCRKYLQTTNDDNCIQLDENDRRQAIIETTPYYCNNSKFFNDLYDDIITNQPALRKIYQYLLQVDLKDFDFVRERPIGELRTDMIENSLQLELKFLRWYCQIPAVYIQNDIKMLSSQLYIEFTKYMEDQRLMDFKFTKNGFSQRMSRIVKNNDISGISRPDIRTTYSYYNIQPKLIIKWFVEHKHLPDNFCINDNIIIKDTEDVMKDCIIFSNNM